MPTQIQLKMVHTVEIEPKSAVPVAAQAPRGPTTIFSTSVQPPPYLGRGGGEKGVEGPRNRRAVSVTLAEGGERGSPFIPSRSTQSPSQGSTQVVFPNGSPCRLFLPASPASVRKAAFP